MTAHPADCMFCAVDLHGHGDGSCGCPECAELLAVDLARNDQLDAAINTVALGIVADLAEQVEVHRAAHPGITDHDWSAVQDRVQYIAAQLGPDEDTYLDAYEALEQRAGVTL